MGGEWRKTTLGEICSFAAGNAFPPSEQGNVFGKYPFIKVSDMNLPGNERFIAVANNWIGEKEQAWLRAKVHPGGATVFAKIGVALTYNRRRILSQPTIIDNNMMAAIPDNSRIHSLFFYYLLCTIDFNEIMVGSALPYLNINDLKCIDVKLPPLPEQRAIAHILGTLDDKIELNRKMNETLEAIARAIFKSWFIDFDPVRAKAEGRDPGLPKEISDLFPDSFEDSELGEIPKGWEIKTLPEAIEINPSRSLKKGDEAPYVDMKHMPTRSHRPSAWITRPFGSGIKFMNGDTLLARITPCLENGKTAFVDFLSDGQVGWGSTEYIVFRPKPPLPDYYGYLLARDERLRDFAIGNMTGSSGRQRVPADCFSNFRIAYSPKEIAEVFGKIVSGFQTAIKIKDEESNTLAAIRDALLPKLISGEIRVKDAERFLKERGL